jgi:hypothetical protein
MVVVVRARDLGATLDHFRSGGIGAWEIGVAETRSGDAVRIDD